MIRLLLKSSVRILKKHLALSIVKASGLAVGMAVFLVTTLYSMYEWSFDKQHPSWQNIFRYVHRVKSGDELQSFAFTSATTGPALQERYPEVREFTRVFKIEVSLKRADADIGFTEKKFAFADPNFPTFFSFPLRNGDAAAVLKAPYRVILTPASAEKYFGDADPVGRSLLLNGAIELVVEAVFADNFSRSHMSFDFVASFATLEAIKNHPTVSKQIPASLNIDHKGFNAFYTYLRLTNPSARATLEAKLPDYIEEFRGKGRSERLKPTLQSLASIHLESDMLYEIDKNSSRAIVWIYIIVGSLILITAIINYTNITTAEFLMRARNVGLKKVLGITRPALLAGHLIETMVVCAVAMLLAGALAILIIPAFNDLMNTAVTLFTDDAILPFAGVYVLTVVLSGFLPSIQIVRQNALRAFRGEPEGHGSSRVLVRNSLVFVQLLVSFVLLSITFLIIRQTDFLLGKDKGFDTSQVMVVNTAGMDPEERILFKDRLTENNAIQEASMCSVPPGESLFTFGLTLPGGDGDDDRRLTFYQMFVDENLLKTLGVDVVDGRFFDARTSADSVTSLVVNRAGAEVIHDSLMSREIEIPNIYTGRPSRKKIIGVIEDFHFASFHSGIEPLILEYNPKYARYLLLRVDQSNARSAIEILEKNWSEYVPTLPLSYYFIDDSFAKYYQTEQRTKRVVTIVSFLVVVLAALGIFGTSLFMIQQRTKEIGLRKLFGSATAALFVLLFRPIFVIFVVACWVGVPIALFIGESWLAGYPYRVSFSAEVLVLTFAVILAAIVITVSSYITNIMNVQPAKVLKDQ